MGEVLEGVGAMADVDGCPFDCPEKVRDVCYS